MGVALDGDPQSTTGGPMHRCEFTAIRILRLIHPTVAPTQGDIWRVAEELRKHEERRSSEHRTKGGSHGRRKTGKKAGARPNR